MVTQRATPRVTGEDEASRTGGITLSSMHPPERLGPVGAYLASEEFGWSTGQVIYSGGSEVAWIVPPRLLEVCRTADSRSVAHVMDTAIPIAFMTAEGAQATNGAGNPRFGPVFDETGPAHPSDQVRRCAVVTDDAAWGEVFGDAFSSRGVTCVGVGAWPGSQHVAADLATDFEGAAAKIAAAGDGGPLDAVVVALTDGGRAPSTDTYDWQEILRDHGDLPDRIRTDAGWARAVADYSAAADRGVRLVTITGATTPGRRSRAQAAAQHARAAHAATSNRVDAFAISMETPEPSERRTAAELAAYLVGNPDTAGLSGAELVVDSGWFGLRSHPSPAMSICFGGPEVPHWLDGTLRRVVTEPAN
jgi:hypothetical protein